MDKNENEDRQVDDGEWEPAAEVDRAVAVVLIIVAFIILVIVTDLILRSLT